MSVLMKIISRLNEYQADRYSVAANRQYGKCLGTSTARIAHKGETDLPDSATLFASHGIGSVGSDICIHMSCMYCVFCHAQLRVFCIRRCSKEDDAEEQGRAQFALRSQLLRHCR